MHYVTLCDVKLVTTHMLTFQASVSGNGQRFFCLANASMALALSAHTLGCNPVSHVSACWLTGLGLSTPCRYLARMLSWNACKLLL